MKFRSDEVSRDKSGKTQIMTSVHSSKRIRRENGTDRFQGYDFTMMKYGKLNLSN